VALLPAAIFFCWLVLPVMPGPRAASVAVRHFPWLLPFVLFFVLLGYLSVGVALVVGSLVTAKEERQARRRLALALLCGFAASLLLLKPTWGIRLWFLRQLSARTQPLIAALEDFKEDRGRYPGSLDALVPDHLARVPGTGMLGDPDFTYKRAEPGDRLSRGGWLADHGAGYDLSASCPMGLVNFDSVHYWPSREYPERAWGGMIEEIDGWAYVHE
jgi:hypothetical protein